jgi:hypothetical protein
MIKDFFHRNRSNIEARMLSFSREQNSHTANGIMFRMFILTMKNSLIFQRSGGM